MRWRIGALSPSISASVIGGSGRGTGHPPLAHLVQDHHDGDADAPNCDGEDPPRRKHKNSKERMLMSIVQTNDHSMENLGEDSNAMRIMGLGSLQKYVANKGFYFLMFFN